MAVRCLDVTVGSTSALKENRFSAKQDPYAVIKLGDQEHRTTSNAYERTRPVWNHRVSFLLPSNDESRQHGANELMIDIFEYGTAKDKHIGHCEISLSTVKDKGSVDIVQPVYRKSGKLLGHLRFHLAILVQQSGSGVPVDNAGAQKDRNRYVKERQEKSSQETVADNRLCSPKVVSLLPELGSWGFNPREPNTGKPLLNGQAEVWQNPKAINSHPGLEPFVQGGNINLPSSLLTLRPGKSLCLEKETGRNSLSLFPSEQGGGVVGPDSSPEKRSRLSEVSGRGSQQVSSVNLPTAYLYGRNQGGAGQPEMSMAPEHEGQGSSPSAFVIPISYWQHLQGGARKGFAPYFADGRGDSGPVFVSDFGKGTQQQVQQQRERLSEIEGGVCNRDGGLTMGAGSDWRSEDRSAYVGEKRKANSSVDDDHKVEYMRTHMSQLGYMLQQGATGSVPNRWQERTFFG